MKRTARSHQSRGVRLHAWLLIALLLAAQPSTGQLLGLGGSLLVDVTGTLISSVSVIATLTLSSGGDCTIAAGTTCGDLEWSSGNIVMQSGGSLVITQASNVYPCECGQPLVVRGGNFACSEAGYVTLAAQSSVAFESCAVSNAQFYLEDQAEFYCRPAPQPVTCRACSMTLSGSSTFGVASTGHFIVAEQSEFSGTGSHIVESGAIHECQDVHYCNHASSTFHDQARLVISGYGSYQCGPGHQLHMEGAVIEHYNLQGQDTIHVQSGAAMRCHPSPSGYPTVHKAGAQINIEANAEVRVHSGAQLQIAGPCTHYGYGAINVEGELRCNAPHTSYAPVNVMGGVHTMDCSQQHSYSTIAYDAASTVNLHASASSGFQAVQCAQASVNGRLNIHTNGYAPSGPVVLMRASSGIQGSFSSCTSDSATFKGAVQASATAVTWFPDASQCSGGCVPVA